MKSVTLPQSYTTSACWFARLILTSAIVSGVGSDNAFAQIGPAPPGEPAIVAQRVIRQNFPESVCPLVIAASRLGDGSIRAICNNGETFRVFHLQQARDFVALRCSAAAQMGVSGC